MNQINNTNNFNVFNNNFNNNQSGEVLNINNNTNNDKSLAEKMEHLVAILVPIACGCVLPIVIFWLIIRDSMNKTNQRTKIVLAAIEKNPDLDIEELMEKISPKKKLLKEKLLSKLQTGNITTLLGIGFLVCALYADYMGGMNSKDLRMLYLAGIILLVVGGAFLRNYFVGKKMLAKEMEAEEKLLVSQAENK